MAGYKIIDIKGLGILSFPLVYLKSAFPPHLQKKLLKLSAIFSDAFSKLPFLLFICLINRIAVIVIFSK